MPEADDVSPSLHLVRENAYLLLQRRLAEIVRVRPELAELREMLLRPVEILVELAQETPPALGDDQLAADRFRILLTSGRMLEINPDGAASVVNGRDNEEHPGHLPWLIDPAALALVGLAAIRVGRQPQLSLSFLRTVHALALAAGPAEVLTRLGADGLRHSTFALLLKSFVNVGPSHASNRFAAASVLLADPIERARWLCLERLFGEQNGIVTSEIELMKEWDGAHADGIHIVENGGAWPGEPCALIGSFPDSRPAGTHVVFAAPKIRPLVVAGQKVTWRDQRIGLIVPSQAGPGWIGFSDEIRTQISNLEREGLRQRWLRRDQKEACLGGSPPPVDLIPDLQHPSVPPRTATNLFSGGRPRIRKATISPPAAAPGESFQLEWESDGADRVRIEDRGGTDLSREEKPQGDLELPVPEEADEVRVRLVPVAVRDERSFEGTPSEDLIGEVLRSGGDLTVVLVRPSVVVEEAGEARLRRVEDEEAQTALRRAARAAGVRLLVMEPAFVTDDLAVVLGNMVGESDPRTGRLLAGLARAALAAPHYEDAIWLALVPGEVPWRAASDSVAARSLAVATPGGLAELLRGLLAQPRPALEPVVDRLRVGGRLWSNGDITLDTARIDRRGAVPVGVKQSTVVCVAVDGEGQEIAVERVWRPDRSSPEVLGVLPVLSPDVSMVELRAKGWRNDAVLASLQRPSGTPRLEGVRIEDNRVSWRYSHEAGARARIAIEVAAITPFLDMRIRDDDGAPMGHVPCWSNLVQSSPCDQREAVPRHRVRGRGHMFRLVASDGWNVVEANLPGEEGGSSAVVVARSLGSGRHFAELSEEMRIEWRLDGELAGSRRLLKLPLRARGLLELHARRAPGDEPIVDSLRIGD